MAIQYNTNLNSKTVKKCIPKCIRCIEAGIKYDTTLGLNNSLVFKNNVVPYFIWGMGKEDKDRRSCFKTLTDVG